MQTGYGCIFKKKTSVAAINITIGVPGQWADKTKPPKEGGGSFFFALAVCAIFATVALETVHRPGLLHRRPPASWDSGGHLPPLAMKPHAPQWDSASQFRRASALLSLQYNDLNPNYHAAAGERFLVEALKKEYYFICPTSWNA